MKHDDPLDPVLVDTRAHVQAEIAAGGRVRDFAAMIARARAIDPTAVSAAALAEVADYAPVVTLRRAPAPGDWLSEETARSPGAARPVVAEPPPRRSTRARAGWIGAAVAAALLLGLVGAARLARETPASRQGNAVQHIGPAPTHEEARAAPELRTPRAPATPIATPPEPPLGPATEPPATDTVTPEVVDVRPPRTRAIEVRAPTGAELDRLAREAWRRNDLDEARRLFALLVATDDDARLVELAFGDLLVLARQTRDSSGLERARRAYLERFPAGMYADDARAGLCRGAAAAATCWQRYLDTHPNGAHVDEARRVVDASQQSP